MGKRQTNRARSRWQPLVVLAVMGVLPIAGIAESENSLLGQCEGEAAGIAAELAAQADRPLSDEERSLARQAALRGCLANASKGAMAPDDTVDNDPVGAAQNVEGAGFWDPILRSGSARTDGVKRLRRRGRY